MGDLDGLHLCGWGCYKLVAFLVTSNRDSQNNVLKTQDLSFSGS